MKLVDVHCHLDMLEVDKIIKNSENKVKAIIGNGVNPETNRKVMEYSKKYDIVKPALGIYPMDSLKMTDEEFEAELDYIREQKPIAIGEIGLDYKEEVDRELMKERFRKQVWLAKELDVPVIVHSRKAEEEVIEILEESGHTKIVMHCFGGKKGLVKRIIQNKWYFSIPCIVVKLHHFQNIVKICPLNRLLTETDAPFMTPYDEGDSEPVFVEESVKKIAEIKGMEAEEIANHVFMNYMKLFM